MKDGIIANRFSAGFTTGTQSKATAKLKNERRSILNLLTKS